MSDSNQQLSNYQQQYIQQYQQYQQYYQNYSQQYWKNAQDNQMDGPSFTGEASVFRARDIRHNDAYGGRQSSSGYRSRSRSRDRDEDSRSDRLQKTLQRLEEQQVMQERVIKDMKMELGGSSSRSTDLGGSRRSSEGLSRSSESYRDYGTSYYGSSSSSYGYGYGSGLGTDKFSSRAPLSSASRSSSSFDGPACFKCNKKGHIAKNCPARDTVCYICNREGHISKQCPQTTSKSSGPMCFKCNENGHLAIHCLAKDKVCYECKKQGHVSKDCPSSMSKSRTGPTCFKCNEKGHLALYCPATEKVCYSCTKSGHVSQDCPIKPSYDTRTCYDCHKPGHLVKNCPTAPVQKCLRCGGMGHIMKNCPSKYGPPYRKSDIQCYRCTGFGHKGSSCVSTQTWKGDSSSSKLSPKSSHATSSSKFKYFRVDAETSVLADVVYEFAKTSYPLPTGCKTREEIDKALKGKEARSRLLAKEIPPAANKSETTISSQCQILGTLKWKDSVYDKLVENLYCFICQKSYTQDKHYQEHVSSKEHRNTVSTLVAPSHGGSGSTVRAKLLKKICSLPSIFEEKLPPVPGTEQNIEGGPDIKADLLNSKAEEKKFFVCRVCHSWGETPFKQHFESEKHKYLYENQWKCEDCNAYFRANSDLVDHQLGAVHKEVVAKAKNARSGSGDNEGASSKKRNLETTEDEHPAAAKKSKHSVGAGATDKGDTALGLQFLLPVTGFYCKLCNKFYNEAKVSKMDHCTAELHNSKLQLWNKENAPPPAASSNGQDVNQTNESGETSGEGENPGEPADKTKEDNDNTGPQEDGDVDMEVKNEEQEEDTAQLEGQLQGQGLMVIDDINDENINVNVEDEGQDTSEPLEAEVASDDEEEEDEETSRATRRGRATRATKSPKPTKKRGRKV